MLKTWSVFVAFLAVALPAGAASLTVKFINMSGDSITRLAATPKNLPGAPTERTFEHPIANGDSGEAFFEATAGSLADDPIERAPQGEFELREEIN